jgi:aquaporin rerated protein, other eukaryote
LGLESPPYKVISYTSLLTIGLLIETILSAQLVLTVYMVAVEKHKSTFLAPLAIGFTLFTAHLAGIHFTGASLNPARSFGPDLITMNFPSYHWIYCMTYRSVV